MFFAEEDAALGSLAVVQWRTTGRIMSARRAPPSMAADPARYAR
jgi:hypothetical protein